MAAVLASPPAADLPATLSSDGEDVAFETYALHRRDPDIRTTGAEYRALLARRDGDLCRTLSGPVASTAMPPVFGAGTLLYPAVSYRVIENRIDAGSDPAWPFAIDARPLGAELARAMLGTPGWQTLAEYARARGLAEPSADLLAAARDLVEDGVLCPCAVS